ncbi:DUF2267 domain-containing protein, partial [Streptomyces sp. NPDC058855]|uniref:DUF2267 domain-containing protein n=1 Tax=Streptomyces sp. NPDC058855 TaxID=3346651 RepID=UPI0036A1DB3F
MLQQTETAIPAPRTGLQESEDYVRLLERVRYEGAHPTREHAEEAVRDVLAALGRQLVGDERVDLAARLPVEAALVLTGQIPALNRLTGWEFVKDLAERTGRTPATAPPRASIAGWKLEAGPLTSRMPSSRWSRG